MGTKAPSAGVKRSAVTPGGYYTAQARRTYAPAGTAGSVYTNNNAGRAASTRSERSTKGIATRRANAIPVRRANRAAAAAARVTATRAPARKAAAPAAKAAAKRVSATKAPAKKVAAKKVTTNREVRQVLKRLAR